MFDKLISSITGNPGAILGLAGDIFGAKESKDSVASQTAANIAAQKEFAQHGIRWKVEDAKAAGLHPLYAMGGSGAAFSPNPIVVNDGLGKAMSNMGQNLSNAAGRQMTQEQHQQQELQNELIRAQINQTNAQADYYRAQSPVVTPGVSVFPYTGGRPGGDMIPGYPLPPKASGAGDANQVVTGPKHNAITYKPAEVKSSRSESPHITPGVNPMMTEFQVGNNRKIMVPHTFSDDAEIPLTLLPMIVKENINRYGFTNTLKAFGLWPDDLNDARHFRQHPSMIRTPPGLYEHLNKPYSERR